jgi:hypothetical protein
MRRRRTVILCASMDEAILQAHDDAREASPLLVHGRLLSTGVLALLVIGDYSSQRMIAKHGGFTLCLSMDDYSAC